MSRRRRHRRPGTASPPHLYFACAPQEPSLHASRGSARALAAGQPLWLHAGDSGMAAGWNTCAAGLANILQLYIRPQSSVAVAGKRSLLAGVLAAPGRLAEAVLLLQLCVKALVTHAHIAAAGGAQLRVLFL